MEEVTYVDTINIFPSKRKRVVLTLEEKLKVIREKDLGLSFEVVAKKHNIGVTTVKDILKNRVRIELGVEKNRHFSVKRKTLREATRPEVESRVYDWFVETTNHGGIISNEDIMKKAREINFECNNESWSPSKGWLGKFKDRYNLISVKHEKLEEQEIESSDWLFENSENVEQLLETKCEDSPARSERGDEMEMNPLQAANVLLEFVAENNFPLKEQISLRMIRDKILEMQNIN